MNRECLHCRFWDAIGGDDAAIGYCKRNAPKPVLAWEVSPKAVFSVMEMRDDGIDANIIWPVMASDDGCGDFMPIEKTHAFES